MSDELRNVYKGAGALDRYFEGQTPVDLFRGRRMVDSTDLMQPTLIGWTTRRGPRFPDVLVRDESGASPQYQTGDLSVLVTEGKGKSKTAELVANADKYIVKGAGP